MLIQFFFRNKAIYLITNLPYIFLIMIKQNQNQSSFKLVFEFKMIQNLVKIWKIVSYLSKLKFYLNK